MGGGSLQDFIGQLNAPGFIPPQPQPMMNGGMPQMAQGGMFDAPNTPYITPDPKTISSQIQQALGAKPQDMGGTIQDILSGRFQPPPPNGHDIAQSFQNTIQQGYYAPAQQIANERMGGGIDLMTKLANMQEAQARGNMYNAMAMNGGGRGEGLAAAQRIMAQYNADPDVISGKKLPMGFTDAYMMATAKQGQGITFNPDGTQTTFGGAPQAAGAMKYGEKAGGAQGEADVNLVMKPQIEGATRTAENNANIKAEGPLKEQGEIGEATGTAQVQLAAAQAAMPQIKKITDDLITLGQAATYTRGGQLYNDALRQLNLPMSAGGNARAEYISRIDNFLLPSLKQAFGARVTNFDIQTAKNILANPDLSPSEKKTQLTAFWDSKLQSLQSEQRQVANLKNLQTPSAPPQVDANGPGMNLPGGNPPNNNDDPLGIR